MESNNRPIENEDQVLLKQFSFDEYNRLMFANLRKSMVQDLVNNRKESVIFTKYPIEQVIRMLESPQKNEKAIRTLSRFLYISSSHYYRLINYYAKLATLNYTVIPANLPKKINKKTYKDTYQKIIYQLEKYNLKNELPKVMVISMLEGVFYGLKYETQDSFYIMPFNSSYAQISSIDTGTFIFSMDLTYFTGKEYILSSYGEEIVNAYYAYKGNQEKGIKGDSNKRWYEPSNGICIKTDETDLLHSLPIFSSIFIDIFRLDDYKLLKKAKTTLDNYKVLALQIECDETGAPKMDWEVAKKYYGQAASNIPDGIGLILSPFQINEFSFQKNSTSEEDAVSAAENEFWSSAGTHGMIFGSMKASSSSSLQLSTIPDQELTFQLLTQIARHFNREIKLQNLPYLFQLKFLQQSIFNKKEVQDQYFKGAQYGVSGAKLYLAASLDMTPSEVVNLAYLENEILDVTNKMFTSPLISSNTVSRSENGVGAPTVEKQGGTPSDNTEASREGDGNNEN
jgi:hypothetical protein